jgi:hypothetical protein
MKKEKQSLPTVSKMFSKNKTEREDNLVTFC